MRIATNDKVLGGLRLTIGTALVLSPRVSVRVCVGPDAGDGGSQLLARVVGVRDVALGLGLLRAAVAGDDVGRWHQFGSMANIADAIATVLAIRSVTPARRAIIPVAATAVAAFGFLAERASRSTI